MSIAEDHARNMLGVLGMLVTERAELPPELFTRAHAESASVTEALSVVLVEAMHAVARAELESMKRVLRAELRVELMKELRKHD